MELFAQADEGGQPEAPRFLAVMMRAQGSSKPTERELFRRAARRCVGGISGCRDDQGRHGLAKDASEATRLYALAASCGANEVSDRRCRPWDTSTRSRSARWCSEALSRLGQSIGKVDGKIGSRTLEAAAMFCASSRPPISVIFWSH
jgi:hypothetical protein